MSRNFKCEMCDMRSFLPEIKSTLFLPYVVIVSILPGDTALSVVFTKQIDSQQSLTGRIHRDKRYCHQDNLNQHLFKQPLRVCVWFAYILKAGDSNSALPTYSCFKRSKYLNKSYDYQRIYHNVFFSWIIYFLMF